LQQEESIKSATPRFQ